MVSDSSYAEVFIFSFVSNYAIKPENLLKVLGILIFGEILINTPFLVLIKTLNRPALLIGLSSNAIKL